MQVLNTHLLHSGRTSAYSSRTDVFLIVCLYFVISSLLCPMTWGILVLTCVHTHCDRVSFPFLFPFILLFILQSCVGAFFQVL